MFGTLDKTGSHHPGFTLVYLVWLHKIVNFVRFSKFWNGNFDLVSSNTLLEAHSGNTALIINTLSSWRKILSLSFSTFQVRLAIFGTSGMNVWWYGRGLRCPKRCFNLRLSVKPSSTSALPDLHQYPAPLSVARLKIIYTLISETYPLEIYQTPNRDTGLQYFEA